MRYLRGYAILVTFGDGLEREVDLADYLQGPVFEPLRDTALFSQVRFDEEAGTAVWPNGADLAPEFLRWGDDAPPAGPLSSGPAS